MSIATHEGTRMIDRSEVNRALAKAIAYKAVRQGS
jgi:hypothetical protein